MEVIDFIMTKSFMSGLGFGVAIGITISLHLLKKLGRIEIG